MKSQPESSSNRSPTTALKVKLGRPTKSSQMQTPLSEEEKRHKRRMANRDSARRMRARRLENYDWLAKQLQTLQEKCRQLEDENGNLCHGNKKLQAENHKLGSLVTQLQGSKIGNALHVGTIQSVEATSVAHSASADSSETDEQFCPLTLLGLPTAAVPEAQATADVSVRTDISSAPFTTPPCPDFSVNMEDSSVPRFLSAEDPLPVTSMVMSPPTSSMPAAVLNVQPATWCQPGGGVSPVPRAPLLDVSMPPALLDELNSISCTNAAQAPVSLSSSRGMPTAGKLNLAQPTSILNPGKQVSSIPAFLTRAPGLHHPPAVWNTLHTSGMQAASIQHLMDCMDFLPDTSVEALNLLNSLASEPISKPYSMPSSMPAVSPGCHTTVSTGNYMDVASNLGNTPLLQSKLQMQNKFANLPLMAPSIAMQSEFNAAVRSDAGVGLNLQKMNASGNGFMGFSDDALSSCFDHLNASQNMLFDSTRACMASSWL